MAALNRPNPVVGLFAPKVLDAATLYTVAASRTLFSYWHGLISFKESILTNQLDMIQLPNQIFTKFL
jgi:hypothetical protein